MTVHPLAVGIFMTACAATHGHHHHGNPDDLEAYIAKMEDPSRDEWQKPDDVVRALAVTEGQTVCDIGAGPGYFALRFARAVGDSGHVYAVDVEPRMLEVLRARIETSGLRNVTPSLALAEHALLPHAACDLIVIVDTFHHFPDAPAYLARLAAALKPNGRIVNIDFHKRELPVGPRPEHKIAREDFLQQAEKAGLRIIAEHKFLPYQYFLVMGRDAALDLTHGLTILAVGDLPRAAQFYASLGWKRSVAAPTYAEFLSADGQRLGLYERAGFAKNTGASPAQVSAGAITATELYFYAADLEAAIATLRAAGARELSPLQRREWGDDAAYFADPDGNVLVVAKPSAR